MWSTKRVAAAAFSILCIAAAPSTAQVSLLQPGVYIRLPGIGQGVITNRSTDSLRVVAKNGTVAVYPLSGLTSVELRGDKSRGAGALRGILWGGGIALPLGLATYAAGDSTNCRSSAGNGQEYNCERRMNLGDVGMITVGGALVGAGIGALIGRRQWHTVRLVTPSVASVSVRPGGVGIAVRVR
jgi:hypothetical protein